MFIESKDLDEFKSVDADICIVGAGVAGITIARELINSGKNVVILESGNLKPESDTQSLNKGLKSGLKYYDLESSRIRAFGGTSHAWHIGENPGFVRLRSLDAMDFEKRDWVPYSGWPITKSELDPYYERAHRVFKIGPCRYDADYWSDQNNKPEISFSDKSIQTTIFQFARKDVFYSDYRKELANAKNIKIYLNATVQNLHLNEYAKHLNSASATFSDGKKIDVHANCFILAQGGLENPRTLLLSDDRMKNGIGNQNDVVGRFFMEHPHLWSGTFYPSDYSIFQNKLLYQIHSENSLKIMGKFVFSEELIRQNKILNNAVSIHHSPMQALKKSVQSIRKLSGAISERNLNLLPELKTVFKNSGVIAYAALRKLINGDREQWFDKKYKYHGFLLNMMSEQSPDPESRIILDRKKDRFGQNCLNLKWKLNSSDIRSIRRFQQIFDEELRKNSLGRIDIDLHDDSVPETIHGGYHHMGTTRMSENPKNGVVDRNCKVHGISNLFVAGSSVFPTVGYANPTLTIVALSIRLTEHLKSGYFNRYAAIEADRVLK